MTEPTPGTLPDPEIVRLLRSTQAEEVQRGAYALDGRYGAKIRGFLRKQFRLAEEDAAEVENDVLERAARRIGTLQDPDDFASWLFSIAYRAGLNRVQRAGPAADMESLDQLLEVLEVEGESPGEEEPTSDRGEWVRIALDPLAERDKEVLSAMVSGLGHEEVAGMLGVTVSNARKLRERALRRAADLLRGAIENPPSQRESR